MLVVVAMVVVTMVLVVVAVVQRPQDTHGAYTANPAGLQRGRFVPGGGAADRHMSWWANRQADFLLGQ